MLCSGTYPESYISEYTSVHESNPPSLARSVDSRALERLR